MYIKNIAPRLSWSEYFEVLGPGQLRKRCTSAIDDRFLILSCSRNRTKTFTHLRNDFPGDNLKKNRFKSKAVHYGPRLLQNRKFHRLEFAESGSEIWSIGEIFSSLMRPEFNYGSHMDEITSTEGVEELESHTESYFWRRWYNALGRY